MLGNVGLWCVLLELFCDVWRIFFLDYFSRSFAAEICERFVNLAHSELVLWFFKKITPMHGVGEKRPFNRGI